MAKSSWLRFYIRFMEWRKSLIGDRGFIILLSVFVGILAGFSALLLKILIHFFESRAGILPYYMFFLLPVIGITLVVFLYKNVFIPAAGFHGIHGVLTAIRKRNAFIHYSLMYVQLITGALTISFGGSSGLESPTVVTGSAIGSNASRFFRLNYRYKTLFIGCGTAATISAIFNAPVAGVIFATEVILPQFSATVFIPILISSAIGSFFSELMLGDSVLFRITGVSEISFKEVPLIFVLGIFAGFISLYFTKVFKFSKWIFAAIKKSWHRVVLGGAILGALIFLFPVLFGEGYIGIRQIIDKDAVTVFEQSVFGGMEKNSVSILVLFGLLIIVKPIASSVTINSGGEGGMFAPSFVTGGFVGYFFYHVALNLLPQSQVLNPVNYVLLGMAGVLAGVMHAPLTAIFLVAEVTESYDLLIALMIVSAIAFFTKYYFDRIAVFFFDLKKQGKELQDSRHEFISLNNIKVRSLVKKQISTLNENEPARRISELFLREGNAFIPVTDNENNLTAVLHNEEIRKSLALKENEKSGFIVKQMASEVLVTVEMREAMDLVLKKFDIYEVDILPVVSNGKFIGIISKNDVLTSYREELNRSVEI